jgi:pimeloyl-ACP methyl ester carboxylesterase
MAADWWQAAFPQGRQILTVRDARGAPLRLAYGEKGQGPPLVLVHGIGHWSYEWRHLIDPLAQHFRVICFDAKGHGFSQKPRDADITHLGTELCQVVRALCDEPPTVMAQSLGALAALAAAQAEPALVARTIAINVPVFAQALPSWGMQLMASLPLPLAEAVDEWRLARPFAAPIRAIVGQTSREVVADARSISARDCYWLTYPYLECPGAIAAFSRILRQAAREIAGAATGRDTYLARLQHNLDAVRCPTLVLWGERDCWFPVADGEALQARLPDARLQVLPGCGHDAAGCSPDRICEAALAFLNETQWPAGRAANLQDSRA